MDYFPVPKELDVLIGFQYHQVQNLSLFCWNNSLKACHIVVFCGLFVGGFLASGIRVGFFLNNLEGRRWSCWTISSRGFYQMPFIPSNPTKQKIWAGLNVFQSPVKSRLSISVLKEGFCSVRTVSDAVRFLVADMHVTPYNAWKRRMSHLLLGWGCCSPLSKSKWKCGVSSPIAFFLWVWF